MTGRVIVAGLAAALALGACAAPPRAPQVTNPPQASNHDITGRVDPRSGGTRAEDHPCGGDHGMLEELTDDQRGRVRVGPPQMSICP